MKTVLFSPEDAYAEAGNWPSRWSSWSVTYEEQWGGGHLALNHNLHIRLWLDIMA